MAIRDGSSCYSSQLWQPVRPTRSTASQLAPGNDRALPARWNRRTHSPPSYAVRKGRRSTASRPPERSKPAPGLRSATAQCPRQFRATCGPDWLIRTDRRNVSGEPKVVRLGEQKVQTCANAWLRQLRFENRFSYKPSHKCLRACNKTSALKTLHGLELGQSARQL
jgi:hypothetical protein